VFENYPAQRWDDARWPAMCADLGSVAEQGLGLEQLLAVLDGLSRSERPLQDQAGGPEWGSAGRGVKGVFDPLGSLARTPFGNRYTNFP
jgi:hypothetical protein